MVSDSKLQKDVLEVLSNDPRVESNRIGVTVTEGVVTLMDTVGSYAEKWAAEEAVKQVEGVRGIANELKVELGGRHVRTDTDLALSALASIKASVLVPDGVHVEVQDGDLSLYGDVDWGFQRDAAQDAVRNIIGVRNVYNQIKIVPKVAPRDLKAEIKRALHRAAELDANAIDVSAEGDHVTLEGNVHSYLHKERAEAAAWRVAGVRSVSNNLHVA